MQRNVPVVVQEVGLTEKHESRQAHISKYTMYNARRNGGGIVLLSRVRKFIESRHIQGVNDSVQTSLVGG